MLSAKSVLEVRRASQSPVLVAGRAPASTRRAWFSLAVPLPPWPAGLVLTAFIAAALVLPTRVEVAVTDDWVYYRTVETLIVEHRLRIHEMSSAALVFQAFWGAAFAALFGLSFATLRVSTLVLVGGGGVALYALCRDLGVSRRWSAIGMAAYLVHPLTFSLAYTFMTDPHFSSLLVISAWLYVRGLRRPAVATRWVLAGSAAAACALLVRQQGVLIPLSVVGGLVLQRRLTWSRHGLLLLAQTSAMPAATTIVYTAWLRFFHGVPWALSLFADDLQQTGWDGVARLIPRLATIEEVYVGLFVLPFAALTLPALWRSGAPLSTTGRWVAAAWTGLAVVGGLVLGLQGRLMPYAEQFVGARGLGPDDVIGGRPTLLDPSLRVGLTVACVCMSATFVMALARAAGRPQRYTGVGWQLLVVIAVGQALGILAPSVHFAVWDGTLDRYLLPLLPLVIVLLLSAVRGGAVSAAVATCVVLAMGLYSMSGTRDYLVFLDSVWSVAREANELGVANTQLDAGAGWDGFQLHQQPPSAAVPPRTPHPPWWIELYAPRTDSSYIVASVPLQGYAVVIERRYWSWLRQEALPVYLLRQPGVPGPP